MHENGTKDNIEVLDSIAVAMSSNKDNEETNGEGE